MLEPADKGAAVRLVVFCREPVAQRVTLTCFLILRKSGNFMVEEIAQYQIGGLHVVVIQCAHQA